jgi:DNA invertase Pin-like site-specific DNA recombinase
MINKRILVYCRESRDEGGVFFERIETQRDILLRFVAAQGLLGEVEVILDDNVSGTDFSRLEGIARRAESGGISTMVFKDASRLGRNLRESLNFLYRMDLCGVEVLFESESYDPELFPLLGWFNERRAGEDSRKVKHVLRHRMQQGGLVFKAPYGYSKGAGKLIIDPVAAGIIRRIFSMRLAGGSTGEIAQSGKPEQPACPAHTLKPGVCRGYVLF